MIRSPASNPPGVFVLNVPGLDRRQVLRVYPGALPARAAGGEEPKDQPVIHDHGRRGQAAGL